MAKIFRDGSKEFLFRVEETAEERESSILAQFAANGMEPAGASVAHVRVAAAAGSAADFFQISFAVAVTGEECGVVVIRGDTLNRNNLYDGVETASWLNTWQPNSPAHAHLSYIPE